jgi:formylglycine-generating enzyme required for sulfatase activity
LSLQLAINTFIENITMKQFYFLLTATLIVFSTFSQTKNTPLKPGHTFRDCKDCPEMVVIPSGSFMMGSPENEPNRYPEEGPQRKVSIEQFAAGKFDITKEQWALFVKETNKPATGGCSWSGMQTDTSVKPWDPNPAANWNHIGFAQDSTHPVVCITWDDVQDYLKWLSKKTGFIYRLLSEAEWEYAARAGTTTAYYSGDSISHDDANYGVDTTYGIGCAKGKDKWLYTSPVGSFPPNAFGLYDMFGNVNQYLKDCFENSYNNLPLNGSPYNADVELKLTGDMSSMNGTNSCSYRMVRGGNYGDPPAILRSAYRNWAPGPGATLQTYSSAACGFRVARTL